jgi:hypothetical protein
MSTIEDDERKSLNERTLSIFASGPNLGCQHPERVEPERVTYSSVAEYKIIRY